MVLLSFSVAQPILQPSPGCPTHCGDTEVAYPFGIGQNCSRSEQFNLQCNKVEDGSYKPLASDGVIHGISVSQGQARIQVYVSYLCYNNSLKDKIDGGIYTVDLTRTAFWLSNTKNRFMVVGSETSAYVNLTRSKSMWYKTGCTSVSLSEQGLVNGSCSGIGCCQSAIPFGMKFYEITFDISFNNSHTASFSPCGYAVLMEAESFKFSTTYLTRPGTFVKDAKKFSTVLDWVVGNETCKIAQQNSTNYACVSRNSRCVDHATGQGYICTCEKGYNGNPYLLDGCKDTNECLIRSNCYGNCTNTLGSFECACPAGTHGNGTVPDGCYKNIGPKIQLWGKLVIVSSSLVYWVYQRRQITTLKEIYFRQYGGHLLLEEMKSEQGFSFRIFKEQELKEATDHFNSKNVVGEGGNGTVYRGTINNKEVAIKKCKTINERQKKEFGKEILILSQINHINIVRILGCCLELEIPVLVYEFISKGTLFDLLHGENAVFISLNTRLRIAHETAEALAYLHSWASPSIVHRDVKTSNILLDENFVAKVSDFGASVLAPTGDEEEFATHVQGTRGYLDPEYMQTGLLTVKSDVYSFGVVLVELLTRKKAFYMEGLEIRSLPAEFLSAMKENSAEAILDNHIIRDRENMGLITQVVELARTCLLMEGERRPDMRQVAAVLHTALKSMESPT
ncbi:putative wall-associated receptor kinase-like 16 [Carex littledalei]|uniref:Putative wall-associated receptor kinase-like 16 n=1 Tax=Carex littledalei TaxID=544730 RepID=A0A833RJ94_9POAL|nr:putative wall-associated receptor kinase-like 16 [Carex littledalei]